MKKRILSIDFDYFIDTDVNTRDDKFPLGIDCVPRNIIENQWNNTYSKYPELKEIGVTKEYEQCMNLLFDLEKGKVLIAESHRSISNLFPLIMDADELEVINVDFHHDNYISSGNRVDCANWVRHLKQLKPNAEILWVRREDSEIESLEGEFPYKHTSDFSNVTGEFDYIFLCYSPEWTPLHLRPFYYNLKLALGHLKHL